MFISRSISKFHITFKASCLISRKIRQINVILWFFTNTVCKCLDFSINQILREINCGESTNSKIAIFAISWTLNFVVLKFQPSKSAKIHKIPNLESLNVSNWQFLSLDSPSLISRKI